MTAAQLRVRTAVRGVFWTAVVLAAYLAAHALPELAYRALSPLLP
ncbi:membrane protein [Arthrobacter phage Ottawa]|nr:membrane protein [Arthrobacter phage Kharcho]WIC89269.1 membrane protein [Arthrobacter phage Ottawa]